MPRDFDRLLVVHDLAADALLESAGGSTMSDVTSIRGDGIGETYVRDTSGTATATVLVDCLVNEVTGDSKERTEHSLASLRVELAEEVIDGEQISSTNPNGNAEFGTFRATFPVASASGDLAGHIFTNGIDFTDNLQTGEYTSREWSYTDTFTLRVAVDGQAPALSVVAVEPQAAPEARQVVQLDVVETGAGLHSLTWEVAGGPPQAITGPAPWVAVVDWRQATSQPRSVRCPVAVDVTVRARDAARPVGNEGVLQLQLIDHVAPEVQIALPTPDFVFPNDGAGASVQVSGTARDHWSGVSQVQYRVDGGSWVNLLSSGAPVVTETAWAVPLRVPEFGRHQVEVRARDAAGNVLDPPQVVQFEVAAPVVVEQRPDLLGLGAYLADLVDFAGRVVAVPANVVAVLTEAERRRYVGVEIGRVFRQSVVRIGSAIGSEPSRPQTEVRAAVQVLRQVLDAERANLVAQWSFKDGSGPSATDSTGNGFVARAIAGEPVWTEGPAGLPAVSLDGGVELEVDDAGALAMRDALTVMAWVRAEEPGSGDAAVIVGKEGEYLLGRLPAGELAVALAVDQPARGWISTGVALPVGQWVHVAVSYDGHRIVAYRDGEPVFRREATGLLGSVRPDVQDVRIGGRQAFTARFHGLLADIRIHRAEVPAAVVARAAGKNPAPIGHWSLNRGSGAQSADELGGRVMILDGADWAPGRDGTALSLAPGQRAVVVDGAGFSPGSGGRDFTVSAWVRPDGPRGQERSSVLHQGTGAERTFEVFLTPAADAIGLRVRTGPGAMEGPSAVVSVGAGRWTHVTCRKDGDWILLSVNGTDRLRHRLTAPVVAVAGPLVLGSGSDGRGFEGLVEDVRVYDDPLTAVEVASIATAADDGQRAYLEAAYRALLQLNGVSFDELRLARTREEADRDRLAARLGIVLRPGRPDQLDELLRPTSALTEAWLEEMFGLADTARDPLTQPPEPRLTAWRREGLRAGWQSQDAVQTEPPLVEPALVDADDLLDSSGLGTVITARRQELEDRRAEVRAAREKTGTPLERFGTAIQAGLEVPASRLEELRARRATGELIGADLAALGLRVRDFDRLLLVRQLAGEATVTDSEWHELDGLLVDAFRRQRWPVWSTEERTLLGGRPLVLPDLFRLRERPAATVPEAFLEARLDWEDVLRARIDQDAAVGTAAEATIADAEVIALPVLRDTLAPTAARVLGIPDGADALSERLLLDVAATGTTSVAGRAVELVGALLFGLRTRRFDGGHPVGGWSVPDVAGFDADWRWMGAHDAWQAAMVAFFYPENLLNPALRPLTSSTPAALRTEAFGTLLEGLRRRDGTPESRVRAALDGYHQKRPKDAPLLPNDYRPDSERLQAHRDLDSDVFGALGAADPPAVVQEVLFFVPLAIARQLHRWGAYPQALDWFRMVWDDTATVGNRAVYGGLRREVNVAPKLSRKFDWLRDLNPHVMARFHGGNPYTRFTLMSLARCLTDFGDNEFTRDTPEARARARVLYLAAQELLGAPELAVPPGATAQGLPVNPALTALRLRVDNQLRKLRDGRNIAGMKRPAEPAEPIVPAQITTGAGGALEPPSAIRLRPTGYRYAVLVERARRLVALAAQIEGAYLSALERQDAETYREVEAGHHLELAGRGVELQRLRVTEARDNTQVARRRQGRSLVLQNTYGEWIDAGPSTYETAMLVATAAAGASRATAIGFQAAAQIAQGYTTAATATFGGAAAAASATLNAAMVGLGAAASVVATAAETAGQVASMHASWERRQDEWELQRALATQDYLVGEQEILVAQDQEQIVAAEAATAEIQRSQAAAVATYLATRFLNSELYEWMAGVLGDVYAYFLQQATATALLAQQQLGFERQLPVARFVKDDYWQPETVEGGGTPVDRRGLTGSARLLQDLEELDQHAFESDRRKLNLTHTFSFAALAPFELQRFRETGVLTFSTPISAFDRAFPGHYLRLVKGVRVSLLALVPPVQGIRATFSASGISRVVVGGESFQEVLIRRDPEEVPLTSPANATGVFELDAQAEMLLPFESMGVATSWRLELPKAANAFDFADIADVYLGIEYTALSDRDYRTQVVAGLSGRVVADRSFSLRSDFPDQWYELNNPDAGRRPYSVTVPLRASDFPPNLEDVAIAHVLLYVAGRDGPAGGLDLDYLRLRPDAAPAGDPPTGGAATTGPDGTVSTRRSSGSTWLPMIGQSPVGAWELSFAGTVAPLVSSGALEDILLVVSFSGVTPAWP